MVAKRASMSVTVSIPGVRPRFPWTLAAVLAVAMVASLLLESPVVVAERASVEAALVGVSPHITGRLTRLVADEGTRVKRGQTIALLESAELADEVTRAEAALAAAEAGLPASRTAVALQDAQQGASSEQAIAVLAGARADLTAQQARMAQADSALTAARLSRERGLVAAQDLVAAESNALAAKALADAAKERVRQAQATLSLARKQTQVGTVERTSPERSAAEIRLAKAALSIARRRLEQTVVVAPADGVLARRLLQVGDQALPGQPILMLLVDGAPWIRAEVREADAPAVSPGARAELMVDAMPYRRWKGHVTRVGVVAESPDPTVGRTDTTVSVMIAPDEPIGPASWLPGMTARARIARAGVQWPSWGGQGP